MEVFSLFVLQKVYNYVSCAWTIVRIHNHFFLIWLSYTKTLCVVYNVGTDNIVRILPMLGVYDCRITYALHNKAIESASPKFIIVHVHFKKFLEVLSQIVSIKINLMIYNFVIFLDKDLYKISCWEEGNNLC